MEQQLYTQVVAEALLWYIHTQLKKGILLVQIFQYHHTQAVAELQVTQPTPLCGDLGAVIVDAIFTRISITAAADADYKVDDNIDLPLHGMRLLQLQIPQLLHYLMEQLLHIKVEHAMQR